MKNFLFLALAGISFFSFINSTSATQTEETTQTEMSNDYTSEIIFLKRLHNAQQKIQSLKDRYNEIDSEKQRADYVNKKYDAMTACNIKLLSDVYQDPADAWKNITKEYDDKELALTIDILNSAPKKTSTGEDANSEMLAHWALGKEVLEDVYASPEKYGKTKDGKRFELWEDQKYSYGEEVNTFLMQINSLLGRTGRIAGISAENDYEKNEEAFQSFLKTLKPEELTKLSQKQRTFPKPPNALPPAHEIMWFNEDPSKSKVVFPAWPKPWQEFISSGFSQYNPNGEMAKMFQEKSLVLKDEIRHQGVDKQNNRLNVYQALKKEKNGAQNSIKIKSNGQKEAIARLQEYLSSLGISAEIDPENIESLTKLEQSLIDVKNKNISIVRDKITKTNPEILNKKKKSTSNDNFLKMSYAEQQEKLKTLDKNSEEYRELRQVMLSSKIYNDYNYINALEKDIAGEINFSSIDAQNIDHLLTEYKAQKALTDVIRKKGQTDFNQLYDKKINDECLNGGI